MSVGVDFDFPKWLAQRRNQASEAAREGSTYAYPGEQSFRQTLSIAPPVRMALEATTRLWRDVARTELLGQATKVSDEQYPRVFLAAKAAGAALKVRVPPIFAAPSSSIGIKVLGTEDAPHLIVNLDLAEKLDEQELIAGIAHELGHVQNNHILYATALHYLTHSAAFFVRWAVQPAILTLRAWSRRAEITCDRAALLAQKDLHTTLTALVKIEMLGKGPTFDVEDYLANPPDATKGLGRFTEVFSSHPFMPKRIAALKLFADSQAFANATGKDPTGKASLPAIDKQVAALL
jgi:Zn-dependent protease with chaperone function